MSVFVLSTVVASFCAELCTCARTRIGNARRIIAVNRNVSRRGVE